MKKKWLLAITSFILITLFTTGLSFFMLPLSSEKADAGSATDWLKLNITYNFLNLEKHEGAPSEYSSGAAPVNCYAWNDTSGSATWGNVLVGQHSKSAKSITGSTSVTTVYSCAIANDVYIALKVADSRYQFTSMTITLSGSTYADEYKIPPSSGGSGTTIANSSGNIYSDYVKDGLYVNQPGDQTYYNIYYRIRNNAFVAQRNVNITFNVEPVDKTIRSYYLRNDADTATLATAVTYRDRPATLFSLSYLGLEIPKKSGYVFKGYYTAKTGGTQVFDANGKGCNVTWQGGSATSQNLYPQWGQYTLNIDANGGNYTTTAVSGGQGSTVTLGIATREGYKFHGWVIDGGEGSGTLSTLGTPHAKMTDPFFNSTTNNVEKYDNGGNNTVAHNYISSPNDLELSNSRRVLEIVNTGASNPGLGGFYSYIHTKANDIYYAVIHAKIPVGYKLQTGANWHGDDNKDKWITSNDGTGKWETYIFKWHCGTTGTFDTVNYFYLQGTAGSTSNPLKWYVAYFGTYDATGTTSADGNILGSVNYSFGSKSATVRALWTLDYWTDYAQEPEGEGTEETPYLITSAEELAWVAKTCNEGNTFEGKYFKQTRNIDLGGKTWTPIGNERENYFSGNYNGQNFNISSLNATENQIFNDNFGLFGRGQSCTLQNIIVSSGNITTPVSCADSGVIIGSVTENSYITGCENHANITVNKSAVGGIVGATHGSTIVDCKNYGNIKNINGHYSAGIIGWSSNVTLKNCYNAGIVENCGNDTGGIVGLGEAIYGSVIIESCKNSGTIKGSSYVGGIVGDMTVQANSILKDCSNSGTVTSTSQRVGGILGHGEYVSVSNCSNLAKVTGQNAVGGVSGFIENSSLMSNCLNGGEIISEAGAGGVSAGVGGGSTLTNCVNKGKVAGGYSVAGISGWNSGANIANSINYGEVNGDTHVGAILGSASSTKIKNCENFGNIQGVENVGGSSGYMQNGSLSNCVNHGDISGATHIGGIVGFNEEGLIEWSINYGQIISTSTDAGGIAGLAGATSIMYCVNEGNIIAHAIAGGILGSTSSSGNVIGYSYAQCDIKQNDVNNTSGGILGYSGVAINPNIHHSFFVGTASGVGISPIYGTYWGGNVKSTVGTCYSVVNANKYFTSGGFSTFQVISGINQGYPVMKELFSIAQEPNGALVLRYFADNGFVYIS